jgi:hypothetical protein
MAFNDKENDKEGGDVNNYATDVVAGGHSDAKVVGVGGAGILSGQVNEGTAAFRLKLCPDGVYREKC